MKDLTNEFCVIAQYPEYSINRKGEVFSIRSNRLLTQSVINSGYKKVMFNIKGVVTNATVHRLVAQTFVPNPNNLPLVNHKDGNKQNNHVDNLEWVDLSENIKHSFRTGLSENAREKARERMSLIGKQNAKINGDRLKEINKQKSKPIQQFDLDGNFIKDWDSRRQAQRETSIFNIEKALSGKQKQAGGYIWKHKNG